MRAKAVFGVELSNFGDHVIQLDANKLAPIVAQDRGVEVLIEPKTHLGMYRLTLLHGDSDESLDESDPETRRLLRFDTNLDGFRAVIIRDIESADLAWSKFVEMFRRPVHKALQRVLAHLRHIANDSEIDVYLNTLKLLSFDTDNGERIYDFEEMDDYNPSLAEHTLTEEEWNGIGEAIAKQRNVPVASDALLNAYMFSRSGNYGMALLNAAIASESYMGQIVKRRLGRVLS